MFDSNDKFQVVMTAAEAAVKIKIEALAAEENDKVDLQPLIAFAKEASSPFYDPRLYLIDFDFDEAKIRRELMVFNAKTFDRPDDLRRQITDLAKVINDAGLQKAIETAEALSTSVINDRILSVETTAQRNITLAFKRVFKTQGVSVAVLQRDALLKQFLVSRKRHESVRNKFREALSNGEMTGVEGDVLVIRNYRDLFSTIETKQTLVETLPHFTTFLEKKVTELEASQA